MATYAAALKQFYDGEVFGETIYSALHASATDADQKRKWATLMQLETETKAWLRPHLVAEGVGVEEHATDRQGLIERLHHYLAMDWTQQMQGLRDTLEAREIPGYQALADEAEARGDARAATVCRYMVEHEKAQVEFARRELAGEPAAALQAITRFLRYPIEAD